MGFKTEYLAILAIITVSVHCYPHTFCTQKETPPGALVLNPGCEVLLGCRGDVSVNGVLLREDTGTLKKNINVANLNGHWVIPDIVNLANEESHSGWRAQETPNYTLNNPSYEDLENGKNSSIKLTKRFRLSQWTLNGKVLRRHKERSGALKLPRLELADAGNYSCIRKGKLLSTIRIIVGIPPKTSAVSCWRKSPKRKIRCEGTVSQLVTPEPECQLLLFQKWTGSFSKVPCSYSLARSSCRCVVGAVVDGSEYVAQLCVTSIAGNVSSPSINFTAFTLLKPDPPALVKVVRVEGMERLLRVSWSYPTSWRQDYYYGLKFQLRYRPVHGMHQVIETTSLSYWILDAMPRAQYEIQLRAKEEHDLGHWSNWALPVYTYTWTAHEPTAASDEYTSLSPWLYVKSFEIPTESGQSTCADNNVWVPLLWVCGLCGLVTLLLLAVYVIRVHTIPNLENITVSPTAEKSNPLESSLQDTGTQNLYLTGQKKGQNGVHFHNTGYFLVQSD